MIAIPTFAQLYTGIKATIEAEMGASIPDIGPSFLRSIAMVQAAKLHQFYLSIGDLQKNIFVDTADPEAMGGTMERFVRVKLGRDRFAAIPGFYEITVTGGIGAVIKASTTFKSNDSALNPSKLYVLDAEYVLIATTDTILVRSLESGLGSKLNIGDKVTATAPIALVDSIATVSTEIQEPLAEEETEELREKAIEAYQLEPNGGAGTDYRLWAADAQGVEQVYPYALSGADGEIVVYVEATIADSIDGKGTPSGSLLTDVEAVIEFDPDVSKPLNERGRRPLGVYSVTAMAIVVREVDVEISGFQGLTPAIQAAILTGITDMLSDVRPFVASADTLANKNDILNIFKFLYAIQLANHSSVFTGITFTIDGAPYASYQFVNGDIPHLNSITYV